MSAATRRPFLPTPQEFPAAAARTRAYLPQEATRDMLLRPIMANVAEACSQMLAALEAALRPEELAALEFISAEEMRDVFERATAAAAGEGGGGGSGAPA